MTLLAKDTVPGKIYRLTRASGTTYYKICDAAQIRRLEKRLSSQSPRFMKPEDRFALQALSRVRKDGHVLAVRVLRFRSDDGGLHESKAYVDFPPDYALREVEKPPGYGAPKRKPEPGYAEHEDPAKGLDTSPGKTEDLG